MLGLPKGEVFLLPWTEEWEKAFNDEKNKIEELIGKEIVNVHHVGSTAVRYLSAKPIIDLGIEIHKLNDGKKFVSHLEKLGYSYKGEDILPERHYFSKGEPRTHQIHMYERGSKYLQEHLAFRDYLRKNETARLEYEKLKIELSQNNSTNKHQYADDKTNFVQGILRKIL